MSFLPKGSRWPNTAEEYPRHPKWLTVAQAADFLDCSVRTIRNLIYMEKSLTVRKVTWRYGCWVRRAIFINQDELEAHRLVRIARKFPLAALGVGASRQVGAVNPLRMWRKARGLRAKQVGELIGVTERQLGVWEHGTKDPDPSWMGKLAALMGVDYNDLVMRWAAWRVLMLAPVPAKGRIDVKLCFGNEQGKLGASHEAKETAQPAAGAQDEPPADPE